MALAQDIFDEHLSVISALKVSRASRYASTDRDKCLGVLLHHLRACLHLPAGQLRQKGRREGCAGY